jgi:hypothetical protein
MLEVTKSALSGLTFALDCHARANPYAAPRKRMKKILPIVTVPLSRGLLP